MINIKLNKNIADNFMFIDVDSGLILTLSNPVGKADRVTPAIRRGFMSKKIIDLDGQLTKEVNEYNESMSKKNQKKQQVIQNAPEFKVDLSELDIEIKNKQVVEPKADDIKLDSKNKEETINTETLEYTQEYLETLSLKQLKEIAPECKLTKKPEVIEYILNQAK